MAYYSLLLSFVLEYIRPGRYYPFVISFKLNLIVPVFAFLLSLVAKSRTSHSEVMRHTTTKWLIYFILLVLISLLVKDHSSRSMGNFEGIVGYFLMYYAIIRLVDTLERLKGAFIILGITHVVIIILNPDLVLDPTTRSYLQSAPFLSDGNDFALSLCIVFPMAIYLFLDANNKYSKIIYLSITTVCVLGIIGTQSRGASLALGAALLFLWIKSKKKALGAVAMSVLVVAALLFASPQYFLRMGTLSNYQSEGSAQGRIYAWQAAFYKMALGNPLTGVGTGNFGVYNKNKTAHSVYFLALGELGFPGVLVPIFFVVSNLRRLGGRIREIDHSNEWEEEYERLFTYLKASMIGFAVAGAFLSCLYYPHIFVLGGLIVSAQCIYEREKEKYSQNELSADAGSRNVEKA